jgi:hypothetical protein
MKHVRRRARASAAVLLLLALAATSCSGDDSDSDEPPAAQSTADGSSFEIETVAEVGNVTGKLPKADRQRLVNGVTAVVQRWFNAAYVGGDYPRSDFKDAFPGFTPGAKTRAHGDQDLLTNKSIGAKVEDVTPTKSRVWVDVLAPNKHAAGVTTRFQLEFKTEGDYARKVSVHGRLLMTRQPGKGWRIFAYDVSKSSKA